MGSRLGHDFQSVRIHTDSKAARSARDIGAAAYTVGTNVVFAKGRYRPYTVEGYRLLTHELTHVVQQNASIGEIGESVSITAPDHPTEVEANRVSDIVASGGTARIGPRSEGSLHISRQQDAGVPLPGGVGGPVTSTPPQAQPAGTDAGAGPSGPGGTTIPTSSTPSGPARSIATDHAQCLAQADQWQFECQERGALLCTALGARLGGTRGTGAGAACVLIYNRACRSTKLTDDAFCNSKRDCLVQGAPNRKKPDECGTWWDNWSSGGSGDPWPAFDEARDRYAEWPES